MRQPVAQMRRQMPGQADIQADKSSSGKKKTVTFYMWAADAEQEFDKAIVAQYEKEHPDIDIEENYIPYAEYLSKINTMAAAGSMPDIFNLPEGNVFEWGEKGALLDLKPLYDAAGVKPSDVSVDSAIFATDENVWSVGYNVTTMCMYYNKELLEQNGIELPSTVASKALVLGGICGKCEEDNQGCQWERAGGCRL